MAELDPWLALYSLWYRGEASLAKLTPADRLPPEFRPLVADDAVERLVADRRLRSAQLRALGIGQLARARDAPDLIGNRNDTLELIQRLSEPDRPWNPDFQGMVDSDSRQERMLQAFRFAIPGMALLSMSTKIEYCFNAMVSTVTVTAKIAKPISSMIGPSDPRNWHSQFEEMWTHSETIAPQPDFIDRDANPAPVTRGQDYDSPFYEEVHTVAPFNGLRLGTIRNILQVSRKASDPQKGGFNYRLVECLSTDMDFGQIRQGGIDRDSGYAMLTADAPDETTLEVQKSIRFTQPSAFQSLTNQMACINTALLLETLVVLAAS